MSKSDTQVTSLDDEGSDVAVATAPAKASRVSANKGAAPTSDDPNRMVTLTIHQGQGDGGNDAVYLGHNEFGRLVPRGVPVEVPAQVVGSLDLAVQTVYTTEGRNVIERQVPRYAYTVRG